MPHLDGCPECMARDNPPATTEPIPDGVQCTYVCRVCGGRWVTAWWDLGGEG